MVLDYRSFFTISGGKSLLSIIQRTVQKLFLGLLIEILNGVLEFGTRSFRKKSPSLTLSARLNSDFHIDLSPIPLSVSQIHKV